MSRSRFAQPQKGWAPRKERLPSLLTTLSLLVSLTPVVTQAQPDERSIEAGPIRVLYGARPSGMRIDVDGIRVVKHSDIVVTTPPWTPHFYLGPSDTAVRNAIVESVPSGQSLVITHRGDGKSFLGTERITATADGVVEQEFEGRMLAPGANAKIQWRMAAWSPSILAGRPYAAVTGQDDAIKGIVPVSPTTEGDPGAMVVAELKSLRLDSRIGPIRIEVESPQSVRFYDYRKSRWANPGDPYFWFGDLGSSVTHDSPVHYKVRYLFTPPNDRPRQSAKVERVVPIREIALVRSQDSDYRPTLTPNPKEIEFTADDFVIHNPESVRSVTGFAPGNAEGSMDVSRPAREALLRHWRALASADAVDESMEQAVPNNVPEPQIDWIHEPNGKLPDEWYGLQVSCTSIKVRATTQAGFLNATQTLKQLTRIGRNKTLVVQGCRVRDWPSLAFRGVHLFTGGQGTTLHEQLIQRVIAATKMNRLVLEAEYIEWESHPETHHPSYGMPKDEVRRILAVCERLGIEVIPLVQSLGHCQWMFENGKNLELAEDPDARWAYCVTNPKTYDFIFDIYGEALDLFKPRMFHIGHDEYADRGRVPYRAESRKYSAEQLFMMDTLRLYEWFNARDIQVMMWGDMLLAEGEGPDACNAASVESATEMRHQLPKDIIITDWHYADDPPEAFKNLGVFHQAGFQTIAATWNRPENIRNFARAALEAGSRGLLQTTWAGYSLDPQSFARNQPQYHAYVIAAEAAWNADRFGGMDALEAGERFMELTGTSLLPLSPSEGWTADLTPAANYSLTATDHTGWFGLGPQHDLSRLPTGRARLKTLTFDMGNSNGPNCIALDGKLSRDLQLPSEVILELDAPAKRLAMLFTTNFACRPGTRVATVQVEFADESRAELPLVYGLNLFAYNDLTPAPEGPVAWRGRTVAETEIALRATMWSLPGNHQSIKRVTIRSEHSPASLVVIAVTGLIQ